MEFYNLNLLKMNLQSKKEGGQVLTEEEEGILGELIQLFGGTMNINESLARAGKECPTCGNAL
ncbi:TPA: hypothetical protein SHV50_003575 [Clostridioides difficile]|nr:hypothetical protein [Clostridioides difficile]